MNVFCCIPEMTPLVPQVARMWFLLVFELMDHCFVHQSVLSAIWDKKACGTGALLRHSMCAPRGKSAANIGRFGSRRCLREMKRIFS
mmetsp:Transcript_10789/g.18084  ORF Transcript_10789/g.18084 Transcript_10789/m.18084 type:complete len:87 (-) Transcript_10789:52-312(-)